MKTMYKVEERVYADCEGKSTKWEVRSNGYVATLEEAKAIAETIKKVTPLDLGDWRITARTMDEATFTVEDAIVEAYDWWKEVGRYEEAKEKVALYTELVEKLEASKANCKTARGLAIKEKMIAQRKQMLARAEATLAEKAR